MKNIYEKYKHIIPFALYFLVYMTWFHGLNKGISGNTRLYILR